MNSVKSSWKRWEMHFMMWNSKDFFTKDWSLNIYRTRCHCMSKLFLCKKLWIGLFLFKSLSFLNGLSYWHQIGLRWKIFWSSFWKNFSWKAHVKFLTFVWTMTQLLVKVLIEKQIFLTPDVAYYLKKVFLIVFPKTTVN